jgi:hypothetical protein
LEIEKEFQDEQINGLKNPGRVNFPGRLIGRVFFLFFQRFAVQRLLKVFAASDEFITLPVGGHAEVPFGVKDPAPLGDDIDKKAWALLLLELLGKDPWCCPLCGKGRLVPHREILRPERKE